MYFVLLYVYVFYACINPHVLLKYTVFRLQTKEFIDGSLQTGGK